MNIGLYFVVHVGLSIIVFDMVRSLIRISKAYVDI